LNEAHCPCDSLSRPVVAKVPFEPNQLVDAQRDFQHFGISQVTPMLRNSHTRPALLAGLLVLATSANLFAQSPSLSEVLTSTPSTPNAVLYADFPALLKVTDNGLYAVETLKKLGEVRLAADLNLAVMSPNWEVGYVNVPGLPDIKDVASLKHGYVEDLQGKKVVWTPDSGYLVPMGNDVVGLVRPANRQLLGSWLKKNPPSAASEFLKASAGESTKFVSMLFALDVRDWLSPSAAKQRLETMPFLRQAKIDDLAKLFSELEGVRVIVGRRNLDECIITLQFASSPAILVPHAKEIFEEVVSRAGISLSEAKSWTATVDGNNLALRGRVDADNIDILLDSFSIQRRSLGGSSSSSVDPAANKVAVASLSFFRQTTDICKKVRESTNKNGAALSVAYNDRMARRIDELGTLDVDPELVDYAAKVSSGLRGFVNTARSNNVQAGVQSTIVRSTSSGVGESYVPYSYGGHVGGWYGGYGGYVSGYAGYYNPNAPLEAATVINQESKAKSKVAYGQVTASIDEMTAEMRRKMTDKYKIQF
jgi:hypothetical protein